MILKRLFNVILLLVLFVGLFIVSPTIVRAEQKNAVSAQDANITPTPATVGTLTTDTVTFSQLLQGEIILFGPYDSSSFSFDLPSEWVITEDAKLNLFMSVSINNTTQNSLTPAPASGPGGTITLRFNDVIIGVVSLGQIGDMNQQFDIPLAAFTSSRSDGRMQLTISLDSALACTYGQQTTVIVHPVSNLLLNHSNTPPVIDLARFPRPIYEKSIFQTSATIVVPDAPTAGELQSALTVAAGLGNISSSALKLDLLPISKLTPELRLGNLIFVGNAASFPSLSQISKFPLLPNNGQFNIAEGNPDDGVIEMINSPWSPFRVVMLVSGNNDAATTKAAQAVSSGVIIPGKQKSLSLVQTVQAKPVPVSVPVDQTLGELGYTRERLSGFGVNSVSYTFYIPPGQTATADAHFELMFGHSALIDFERSGLVVNINSQPIGSVRLTQETAAESINIAQFSIPPSVLVPGNNRIDIIATLQPFSNCNPPDFSALWLNIWPESNLHLPLTTPQINLLSALDLSKYPAPYVFNPVLGNTAFVLQKNLPETWNNAAQIAAYLGDRVNGPITAFKTFFDGEIPEDELPINNFIVVGHPSELAIVKQLTDNLPAPFKDNSDDIIERNMQVIFRLSPDTSVGYVEFLQSPWSSDTIIILALGNNLEGISWASSSLTDTPLGSRLAGDFAVINDGEKMTTTDTRITPYVAETIPTASASGSEVVPQVVVPTAAPSVEKPAWVLVVLIISIVAVLLVLLFVIVNSWRQNRVGTKAVDARSPVEFVKQLFAKSDSELNSESDEDKSKGKKL